MRILQKDAFKLTDKRMADFQYLTRSLGPATERQRDTRQSQNGWYRQDPCGELVRFRFDHRGGDAPNQSVVLTRNAGDGVDIRVIARDTASFTEVRACIGNCLANTVDEAISVDPARVRATFLTGHPRTHKATVDWVACEGRWIAAPAKSESIVFGHMRERYTHHQYQQVSLHTCSPKFEASELAVDAAANDK